MAEKWNLVIDIDECINCQNCTLAVQDEYAECAHPGYAAPMPKHGHRWIDIKRTERGRHPIIDVSFIPVMCNHCDDATCFAAAENGAIEKRVDGIVLIHPDKAKGQRQLVDACPFGAIWWNEDEQVPQHWNFDAHLLDCGWKEPRCVNVCPTGALESLKISDVQMAKKAEAENLEVLLPELSVKPRVYYKNLFRYSKAFVAGSVTRAVDDREECAAGVSVVLSHAGETVATTGTDDFGDFLFDGLDKFSGNYLLQIQQDGQPPLNKKVKIENSVVVEISI